MDVLLTHSNHVFNDRKQVQKMQPYPPLQTLLAAAMLRQKGLNVGFCDVTLQNPETAFTEIVKREKPALVVVCEDDFNFLTKMCLSQSRELAFWMGNFARSQGCGTAAHGSDATDNSGAYIDAGFDYVFYGEVEDTLAELATATQPESIPGLVYRDANGRTQRTSPRSIRTDLDSLAMPAWDLIDIEPYRRAWLHHHGFFSMNLVSSRGCPYRCNWCAKPIYGSNYHVRSARAVAEEMLHLKTNYAPDHLWFADDIFALSARWTREFADTVEQLDAAIPFKMQSRCDLMTRDTVINLRRAGCHEVWMGAESGSQRILDAMEKGTRVQQVIQASENLRRHHIRAAWFLQFGYPGENWQDIELTIRMLRAGKPDDVGISVTYPLPGTKLHQLVSHQLGTKKHWSDSGDLSMMFRGTFSTDLYRALSEAIHQEVRNPQNTAAVAHAWAEVDRLKPVHAFKEAVV